MDVVCTKEKPWDGVIPENLGQVIHPDAKEVGEQENGWPAGDIITLECPHCKTQWKQELPQ